MTTALFILAIGNIFSFACVVWFGRRHVDMVGQVEDMAVTLSGAIAERDYWKRAALIRTDGRPSVGVTICSSQSFDGLTTHQLEQSKLH